MNQLIAHNELFVVILEMNQMKKKRKINLKNIVFKIKSFIFNRKLTTEHNSNSSDSIDDVVENNLDKRPQYKNIMNNIRRGIRTDDDVATEKRVGTFN
jgi:hypothetical protein